MTKHQASYVDAYLEPFAEWLSNHDISEFAINPDGQVWIERAGDAHMVAVAICTVDARTAIDIAQAIVGDAKAKVSKSRPLVSGKIDYRGRPLRVQVAIPPAVEHGASLSVRLFSSEGLPDYEAEYLFGEAVSLEAKRREKMAEVRNLAESDLNMALKRLIELRLNILISGGTSTGKTTFARHLLDYVGIFAVVADLILCPTLLSQSDLETARGTANYLYRMKDRADDPSLVPEFRIVLNRLTSRPSAGDAALIRTINATPLVGSDLDHPSEKLNILPATLQEREAYKVMDREGLLGRVLARHDEVSPAFAKNPKHLTNALAEAEGLLTACMTMIEGKPA